MIPQTPTSQTPLLPDNGSSTSHNASNHISSPLLSSRLAATMLSFLILGLFQSSIGALLHPLSQSYSLSDLHVSLVFLVGPLGYVIAAQSSDRIHRSYGQRGVAILGPMLHILGAVALALHPPFWVVLMAFGGVAMGIGLLDGSWCSWSAGQKNANAVSGMMHGGFSVGAAAGPFFAGKVLQNWKQEWWVWYYFLAAASFFELCILFLAFQSEDAEKYHQEKHNGGGAIVEASNHKAVVRYRATWLIALYLLTYVGCESAISGWVISFLLRNRHASSQLANIASSAFWAGMATGRFSLGVVTDRIGVGRANTIYFVIILLFQIMFVFVESPTVSVIIMTFVGFFMGPMFVSGTVVLARLLPKELQVAAMSLVASAGQVGAAVLPFGIGALVQVVGIGGFRFALVGFEAATLGAWALVWREEKRLSSLKAYEDDEEEEEGVDHGS